MPDAGNSPQPARDVSIRIGTIQMVVMALCVVAAWLYVVQRPLLWLLGVMPDDAFYYLQIARHIAGTGVSTFDGINPTNGYHPAWMAITTLGALLVADREVLLRTMLLVALLFHLGAGLVMARVLGSLIGR